MAKKKHHQKKKETIGKKTGILIANPEKEEKKETESKAQPNIFHLDTVELEKLAAVDNVDAQVYLAFKYSVDEPIDLSKAKKWFDKAAASETDCPAREFARAMRHLPEDAPKFPRDNLAYKHLKDAAEKNFSLAQFTLGQLHEKLGDEQKSSMWYKKSAALGFSLAQTKTGLFYKSSQNENDLVKAAWWLSNAASQGDPAARFHLCALFQTMKKMHHGITAKGDFEIYQKTKEIAEKGDTFALLLLGILYQVGCFTEPSLEKSFSCYEKAANLGNPHAQLILAECCTEGQGCTKDEKMAFALYEKVAEKESLPALGMLALFHFSGIGTEKNQNFGLNLYQLAMNQDINMHHFRFFPNQKTSPNTEEFLLDTPEVKFFQYLYSQGKMIQAAAVQLFLFAANKDNISALFHLSLVYNLGMGGVEKDENKARKYRETCDSLLKTNILKGENPSLTLKVSKSFFTYNTLFFQASLSTQTSSPLANTSLAPEAI